MRGRLLGIGSTKIAIVRESYMQVGPRGVQARERQPRGRKAGMVVAESGRLSTECMVVQCTTSPVSVLTQSCAMHESVSEGKSK